MVPLFDTFKINWPDTSTEGRRLLMKMLDKCSTNKAHLAVVINGEKVEADIDPCMTLAEFLREELDLTGTKVGCNRGECGSCTVIVDGEAVYSCTTLAIETGGKEVQTIEGLSADAALHPLQQAFMDNDALQCGYCTPGMILSAKALLDKNDLPAEHEVRVAVEGNLCRCGSTPNIIAATLAVSRMAKHQERSKS